MPVPRMSRRCRKHLSKIQKAESKYELQQIASDVQSELDRRNISYDEALNVGNVLQDKADSMSGDEIVYAISDRDSYRRTLELYLKDGILTATEQLLLWEERRRLGITDDDHERLLMQLLAQWKKQGKAVTIHNFRRGGDAVE